MGNFRWGIIGPGKIAKRFATAITHLQGAEVAAIASRNPEKAAAFAHEFKVKKTFNHYEDLATSPDIDAIYIATPHGLHREHALLCLQHHKPVLCEKPMSTTLKNTQAMVDAARKNNTFLMEALWTRFLPATLKVDELIKAGAIGDIKFVRGDFGFAFPYDPTSRVFDLKLGAGSLLDVGVYPLFLILFLLGEPDEIKSFAHLSPTGSDELMNATLYYKNGTMGNLLSATHTDTPLTAEIMGTQGTIAMASPWYKTQSITLYQKGKDPQVFPLPYPGTGFEFQIEEVMACLARGEKESPRMKLDFSLMMARTSDIIAKQCGLFYDE